MKSKAFTVVVMLVMVLTGAAYWADLSLFINPATGFVQTGPLWVRYVVLAAVLVLAAFGLRGVSPHAIGVLRVKNRKLSILFVLAGVSGLVFGVFSAALAVPSLVAVTLDSEPVLALVVSVVYQLLLGLLFVWYGIWMLLAARQLQKQSRPSPTQSAGPGMLAAMPFCLQTVYRVLINPSSVYRTANIVHIFTALFSMLWFGMLLRALYIALVRQRVRWMYLFGLVTFLFATCLEFAGALHTIVAGEFALLPLLEGICTGFFGLTAGVVSISIVSINTAPGAPALGNAPKPEKKVYRRAQF
ncbi:hypothetical protein LJC61_04925 [Ruminococcaceae bacterium OttesenSCG-928-A16]|nr:hypothetical protein [Ruminococcaceae bacterium OttesenSCG-928-A16]